MPDLNKMASGKDWTRQTLNLLFAIAQFFVPFFSQLAGIGQSIEAQAGKDIATSPEVPADYAFSIWFVIFILSAIYAVYQRLPSQRENQLFRKIGWWTAASFFLSTLWMLIVQLFGDGWFLAILIILMLFSTLKAFFGFIQQTKPQSGFDRFVMTPLLGLFSGWLSVAAFLNTASVLKASSLHTFGLSINGFAVVTILSALVLALRVMIKSRGNLWYGGTILWALTGVIVANVTRTQNPMIVCVAVSLLLVVIFTLFYSRKRLAAGNPSLPIRF